MTWCLCLQSGYTFEISQYCTVYSRPSQFVIMSSMGIFIPGVLLCTLYGSIIVVIIRRQGKWNATVAAEQVGGQVIILSTLQKEQAARRQKRSIRVALTCAVVTLLFLACWLPAWTITLLMVFKISRASYIVHHWAVVCVYLHCSMSPVVYFIADDRFRFVLLRLVCRKDADGGATST